MEVLLHIIHRHQAAQELVAQEAMVLRMLNQQRVAVLLLRPLAQLLGMGVLAFLNILFFKLSGQKAEQRLLKLATG
tara:strand:- start:155 stop:382 length:228 start_codon:yes stop_codon:yes gene_type:complete